MAVRSRILKAPAVLLFPSPVLQQRYSCLQEIGHGGCARVYSAWDEQRGRRVVVKRAHADPTCWAMLQVEAEVLQCLHHSSIPMFLDWFEEDGRCYLVEEWKPGTALKEMRFFALPQVLQIGRQCSEILASVHQAGVIHCDLAPGNVLIAEKGLSLIDFGLARRQGDPPQYRGTPGYAAPEQWNAGRYSAAGDVHGLGMLLGCALTDTQPQEVQQTRSFARLWADPGRIPAELLPLLALLDRMIALSPDARPDLAQVQHVLCHLDCAQ